MRYRYLYGNWSKVDARAQLCSLIREIGPGFHWETPADGYAPPLPEYIARCYPRVLAKAREVLGDEAFESCAFDCARQMLKGRNVP